MAVSLLNMRLYRAVSVFIESRCCGEQKVCSGNGEYKRQHKQPITVFHGTLVVSV